MLKIISELRVTCELEFNKCFVRTPLGNRKIHWASSAVGFTVYIESRCKPGETIQDIQQEIAASESSLPALAFASVQNSE